MEVLSEHPAYPIEFCSRTKTFEMKYDEGLGHHRLYYCFGCGGKLPEEDYSKRPVPDKRERKEVEITLSNARTIADVVSALGPPDEESPWVDGPGTEIYHELANRYPDQYVHGRKWQRCLRYFKRWPSLLLDVYEFDGGEIEYLIWEQSKD
jgi:hypothetical protein